MTDWQTHAALRSRREASKASGVALLVFGFFAAGCVSVAGYQRGEVVPVDELVRHRDDPVALAVRLLAEGRPALAFHALEVGRTMRFVGEQLVRRDHRQRAASGLTLGDDLRISAASAGTDCRDDLPGSCGRAGPSLAVRGGSRGLVMQRLGAARRARDQTAQDQFWTDYKIVERRLEAFARSEGVRSYRSIFHGRFVVPSAANAQLSLGPEQAYVSYLIADVAWALVVTRRGSHAVRLAAPPDAIAAAAAALRVAILCPTYRPDVQLRRCGPRWHEAWQAPAAQLHAMVLAPIESHLQGATSLFVASDGPLVHVPFAVLRNADGQLAIRRRRITYVPSLSIYLMALNRKRSEAPPSMLAVGDPLHELAQTMRLPMAALEATTVGGIFDGSTVRIDATASEVSVLRDIASHNVLHFATHGIASRDDPLLSALLLASGDGGDGLLTADEIRWLNLDHLHVAVLSACETAVASEAHGGDAALSSLVGSFLVAGAPAVVGTFWQVNDTSTTLLMMRFYEAFLEVGVSEAIRRAQLDLSGHAEFGHPFYWAAFSPWGIDS